MAKSIGVDLGTTNSVAAIKQVETTVLRNRDGDLITPSCVSIKKGGLLSSKKEFIVGKNALDWLKQDPKNTITAVKRLMGRNFHDDEVQDIIANDKLSYEITSIERGTWNSLSVVLGGSRYTPEHISAIILESICSDAKIALNDDIDYTVITVPAYFNDKQKHATRTAAALAGLKVRRLLPEPTAAAISFGVDNVAGEETKTVLVFDFGGGTFDLSVLTISGGQFIEQGKGGNMWLGGVDIDNILFDYVLNKTAGDNNIDNIRELIRSQDEKRRNRLTGELKAKVEAAKIALSSRDEAYIEVPGLLMDKDGDAINIEVELTRQQFDKLIEPVIKETVDTIRKMLDDIHFTPDLIDSILLVGGSSQIPGIIQAVKREFGEEKVLVHERPMLAVAEGAAILSHRLADTVECPQCGKVLNQSEKACSGCSFNMEEYTINRGIYDIVHSTAHDYYIQLENRKKHLFVKKNTSLPCEVTETFELVNPEQVLIHMKFFNVVNEDDESIGDLWLGIDEPLHDRIEDRKKPLSIDITFRIDRNNIIEIKAAIKEFPDVKISKTISRGYADEKLFLSVEEMINQANAKKYPLYRMIDLEYRALSSVRDINNILDSDTSRINEAVYNRAALKLEKAGKFVETDVSSKTLVFYAREAVSSFGSIMPPQTRSEIEERIKKLEEMDESGTYEENLAAWKKLDNTLESKLGIVNTLMEIKKARDYCYDEAPSKAERFNEYIGKIIDAASRLDRARVHSLLNEIMPEAYKITEPHETGTKTIHKDIRK